MAHTMTLNRDEMRLAEEAAKWADRRRREPSETSYEFVAWLRLNPRHIDEYLLSQAIVEALTQVPLDGIDVEELVAASSSSAAIQEIGSDPNAAHRFCPTLGNERVSDAGQQSRRDWRPFQRVGIVAALATTLLVIGTATVWWAALERNRTYSTGLGEQRTIRLTDGSLLELNAQSTVRVKFSKSARRVELLRGEALFIVAHNPTRPFRVAADNTVVQAVGTQFDVYRREGAATHVAVVEGRVQVFQEREQRTDPNPIYPVTNTSQSPHLTSAVTSTLIAAGEEAQVTDDGRVIKSEQPDVTNAVAWRQRRIVFNSTTLADVVKEFARYSDFRIQVKGDALAQRRIRGSFHADEPQALLALFAGDPTVEIIHVEDGVIIKAR
jgi:transmembrane sensor